MTRYIVNYEINRYFDFR